MRKIQQYIVGVVSVAVLCAALAVAQDTDNKKPNSTISSQLAADKTGALVTVKPEWISHDTGFAYIIGGVCAELKPGDNAGGNHSTLILLEDGVPLDPPHVLHAEIRTEGKGRYSHWNSNIWFAASDNTDPRDNGRHYQVAYLLKDW